MRAKTMHNKTTSFHILIYIYIYIDTVLYGVAAYLLQYSTYVFY